MNHLKRIGFIVLAMALLFTAACGRDSKTNKNVSITISPITTTVSSGGNVTLTVTPTNTEVTWPVLSTGQGSYTKNGNQAIYTAPVVTAEGTIIEFTVTAAADNSKKATATITVQAPIINEDINVMGRADAPDGSPLGNTEFQVEVYVPSTRVTQFSFTDSWDAEGWTLYTINSYTTDENGYYYLSLPFEGEYLVQLTFEDYDAFVQYISIIDVSRVEEINPVVLVPESGGEGTFLGTLRDATTDFPLSGATIEVRQNWNNIYEGNFEAISTNASGVFEINLPYGYYTFYAILDGYIRAVMNVSVYADEVSGTYHMNPVYDGEYRIVLTWGQNPRDLDSHLLAPGVRVYFYNPNAPNGYAHLDIDVTNGYGPETITIYNLAGLGGIRYAVHDFSNYYGHGKDLSASNAIVRVYKGENLVKTYYVPVNTEGTTWYVFEMSATGVITDLNTFGFEDPDDY